MIKLHDAAKIIRNKNDLHDALQRNGYRMPELKAKVCTREFLLDAYIQSIWLPRLNEVCLSPCPTPPPQKEIHAELVRTIRLNLHTLNQDLRRRFERLVGHLQNRQADVKWMLDILSTITRGNHPYFAKGFRYVRPPRQNHESIGNMMVPNPNNFFDGLPPSRQRNPNAQGLILVQSDQ